MVVSLPASSAGSPARVRPIAKPVPVAGRFGANAPSVSLPLAFILTGLLALVAGIFWLAVHPELLAAYHYNQYVIAATHLLVLGWICSVVMGAMYQLVPVALETRLYSERLAWCQFGCHLIGFLGMVAMFQIWNMKQVGHYGSVLTVGVGLFVYNLVRTLRRAPKWNVTATAVAAALFWISFAVLAGLSLTAAKCAYDSNEGLATANGVRSAISGLRAIAGFISRFDAISAMHAHAHLGSVGLFTILLVGVSYKLIPMFTLSEIQSKRRAACSVGLLNLGLAGSFVTILLRSSWKPLFALLVVGALVIYGWELGAILRARKRKMLDWGIKYFLSAIVLMLPVSLLGLVLSWPGLPLNQITGQLENLYGFLGFIGVISLAIIGMLYKIIPFLVWFRRYSPQIGKTQVPSLADLYSSRLQAIGYWVLLAGIAVNSIGIVLSSKPCVRTGCALLAAAVMTLVLNVVRMLSHFYKPNPRPLTMNTNAARLV